MENIALIADLDGTLVDTAQAIHATVCEVLQQYHLPPPTLDDFEHTCGLSLEDTYRYLVPDLPQTDLSKIHKLHKKIQNYYLHLACVFDGVSETLSILKKNGIKICIATNRSARSTYKILDETNLAKFTNHVVAIDDVTHPKPHPESIIKGILYLGAKPSHTVVIGDTQHDIEAGKSAGVWQVVRVVYGSGNRTIYQAGSDILIDDSKKLPYFLPKIFEEIKARQKVIYSK